MLVTFTTKGHADITMYGDVAVALLKMMGYSAKVPGAILADNLPAALERLTTAIAREKTPPPKDDKDSGHDDNEPKVSLAHRALPLINLLTGKCECDVN